MNRERISEKFCSLVVGFALALAPGVTRAAAPTVEAEPVSVEAALASGDLSAARSQAEAARKASPSAASWGLLAEVCEQQEDLACARAARTQQRDLLGKDSPERTAVEARLAALEDMSRGTVADEPASTQRAGLDQARRDRELALLPKPKVDRPKPVPPAPKEKVAKKWYFWVAILAIAASGAAITAFAVKAAKDDRPDDLDASAGRVRLPMDQGFGLRF
jgi:hypothetical protein